MPTAVQLDHQLRPEAVEIHDVMVDALLPLKPDRIAPQKAIPKPPLPGGHVLTKLLCKYLILFLMPQTSRLLPAGRKPR
jgi:hypothetical protein